MRLFVTCVEDLRIYALLTSCDPLRLFIYNDGLVRMSTERYETPSRNNAVKISRETLTRSCSLFSRIYLCI
jgi:hypothetical protein